MPLWEEVRAEALPRAASCGPAAVARGNARRALHLATEGRYGDTLQALGSSGTASPEDQATREELSARHPTHRLPTKDSNCPPPLVVDAEAVLAALRGFPCGSSPGGSKLRIQHLLDAVAGTTVPAAQSCLQELTRWVNTLLAGQVHECLAPWIVGAPLTALLKPGGGIRPIAVGEVFRRLTSRLCCSAVHQQLPHVFLPHGQVGVGIPGGLEAAVHGVRHFATIWRMRAFVC